MANPAPIIIHNMEHVSAALTAATTQQCPIILQSAPDALRYVGSLYLLKLFEQARTEAPDINITFILDCADAPALAIAALNDGHRAIRIRGNEEAQRKVKDIADHYNAAIFTGSPEVLDLLNAKDPVQDCINWLIQHAKD